VNLEEIKKLIDKMYPESKFYLKPKQMSVEVRQGLWRRANIKFVSNKQLEIYIYRPWTSFDKKVLRDVLCEYLKKLNRIDRFGLFC